MRKDKQTDIKIEAAYYLRNYQVLILFSNNRMKIVDFAPAILQYAKGDYAVYAQKKNFCNFYIENGNIVWGTNWDLIFPIESVYNADF